MKKYLPHVLFIALIATYAWASSIKVWSSGEVLRSADLNSNFAHIHNTKVGDGVLLVNSDVSGTAAISHSKLATPALIPKVWVKFGGGGAAACTASPCTVLDSSGVSGVTRTAQGQYLVTISSARADTNYATLATMNGGGGTAITCVSGAVSTTTMTVICYDAAGATQDSIATLVLFDS